MPGMSGLELLPRARKARPDVPVIMITAYGDAETRRKAIEGGAAGLFTKPIDFPGTARRDRPPARSRDGSGMTAKILVVDDEPDLEDLVTQKFRRQIKRRRRLPSASRATASRRSPSSPRTAISTWSSPTSTCRGWTG